MSYLIRGFSRLFRGRRAVRVGHKGFIKDLLGDVLDLCTFNHIYSTCVILRSPAQYILNCHCILFFYPFYMLCL